MFHFCLNCLHLIGVFDGLMLERGRQNNWAIKAQTLKETSVQEKQKTRQCRISFPHPTLLPADTLPIPKARLLNTDMQSAVIFTVVPLISLTRVWDRVMDSLRNLHSVEAGSLVYIGMCCTDIPHGHCRRSHWCSSNHLLKFHIGRRCRQSQDCICISHNHTVLVLEREGGKFRTERIPRICNSVGKPKFASKYNLTALYSAKSHP